MIRLSCQPVQGQLASSAGKLRLQMAIHSTQLDPDSIGPRGQHQTFAFRAQPHDDAFVILKPEPAVALVRQSPSNTNLPVNPLEVGSPGKLVDIAGRFDFRGANAADPEAIDCKAVGMSMEKEGSAAERRAADEGDLCLVDCNFAHWPR
jgi:hypothetical protein